MKALYIYNKVSGASWDRNSPGLQLWNITSRIYRNGTRRFMTAFDRTRVCDSKDVIGTGD
jgi:hypothetical protein